MTIYAHNQLHHSIFHSNKPTITLVSLAYNDAKHNNLKMQIMKNILILGIGNLVLNDAGVGQHIVHILKSLVMPDGVDILDGGMGGKSLVTTLCQYNRLILIDAATDNFPVGTVRRLSPRFPQDYPLQLSTHQQGVRDIIDAIQERDKAPQIDMLAISVNSRPTLGMQLSPEVRKVIPQVVQLILEIIEDKRSIYQFC